MPLPWSKHIVRTMCTELPQLQAAGQEWGLKLVTYTSLNKRMQMQRGGERAIQNWRPKNLLSLLSSSLGSEVKSLQHRNKLVW